MDFHPHIWIQELGLTEIPASDEGSQHSTEFQMNQKTMGILQRMDVFDEAVKAEEFRLQQ